jgi:hypothetical protein
MVCVRLANLQMTEKRSGPEGTRNPCPPPCEGRRSSLPDVFQVRKKPANARISVSFLFPAFQEIDECCCTGTAQVQEDRHGRGLIVYGIITAPICALPLPSMYEQTLKP